MDTVWYLWGAVLRRRERERERRCLLRNDRLDPKKLTPLIYPFLFTPTLYQLIQPRMSVLIGLCFVAPVIFFLPCPYSCLSTIPQSYMEGLLSLSRWRLMKSQKHSTISAMEIDEVFSDAIHHQVCMFKILSIHI
ncbi:hypothetical protein BDE02_08G081700 [Populus trichocarpa]|nr:hypothetical protein BDE02_08G081700 [Populus trichocarpa]